MGDGEWMEGGQETGIEKWGRRMGVTTRPDEAISYVGGRATDHGRESKE
jgi:hypothetical protein